MSRHRLLVLLGLVVALLAPTASVAAIGYEDSGGASTAGGGNQDTNGDVFCQNGEGWFRNNSGQTYKIYDYPFSQCAPAQLRGNVICVPTDCRLSTTTTALRRTIEPTHYEVWRFYGTRAQPIRSWTMSRVNFVWAQQNVPLAFFSPHPNDRGGVAGGGYVSQYQYHRLKSVYEEEMVMTCVRRSGATIDNCGQAEFADLTYTTQVPLLRYGSCESLISSDNPFASLDATAQELLRQLYNNWAPRWTHSTALVMTNLRSMSPMAYNDGIACTSGVEFTRPLSVTTSNPGATPVYGTCWIPVERKALNFTSATTGAVVKNWPVTGGHRYDATRYPAYSSGSVDPTTGRTPAYHADWRAGIAVEVNARSMRDLYPPDGWHGSPFFTPGDPYYKHLGEGDPNLFRKTSDRSRAASMASIHAHCVDGPLSAAEERDCPTGACVPPPPPTTPPPDTPPPPTASGANATVTVTVESPEVFNMTAVPESGASVQRQRVESVSHSFTCHANCGGAGLPSPHMVSMTSRLVVYGTNGYVNYDVVARKTAGGYGATAYVDLEFTRATEPNQMMRIDSESEGTWRRYTERRSVTVPACQTCSETVTISWIVWEDLPVGIIKEGAPVDRRVMGATSIWRS
jgi:hypothetical protein